MGGPLDDTTILSIDFNAAKTFALSGFTKCNYLKGANSIYTSFIPLVMLYYFDSSDIMTRGWGFTLGLSQYKASSVSLNRYGLNVVALIERSS